MGINNILLELDQLSQYMDFYIRCLIEKECIYFSYDGLKNSRVSNIPTFEQFKELTKERCFSEHYYIDNNRKVSVMHMGAGYRDENALMRREYSWWNGIAFNFSGIECFTINNGNVIDKGSDIVNIFLR